MANCKMCGLEAGPSVEICDHCKRKSAKGMVRGSLPVRKLSSIALVREAVAVINRKRVALSLAVLLPTLCSSAIRMTCTVYICSNDDGPRIYAYFLFSFAGVPFYVMFATVCHRIVLLGDASLPKRWGLFWSARETRFLGWLLVLGLITFTVSMPIWYSIYLWPDWAVEVSLKWPVISFAFLTCVVVSTYIDGRFGLLFPAAAIGNRMNLLASWRYTAGNGLPIFVALMVPILVTHLIDHLLFAMLIDSKSLLVKFLRGLLYYPLFAVGVVVITIAYRDLVPSTDSEAAD